jgi:hypothetical protein
LFTSDATVVAKFPKCKFSWLEFSATYMPKQLSLARPWSRLVHSRIWQNSIRKPAPPEKLIVTGENKDRRHFVSQKALFLRQFPVSVFIRVYSCPSWLRFARSSKNTHYGRREQQAASVP